MIRKYDVVEILGEFRDPGDEDFTWVALSDEDRGRVDIKPIDHPMRIKPVYTVTVDQIRTLRPSDAAL